MTDTTKLNPIKMTQNSDSVDDWVAMICKVAKIRKPSKKSHWYTVLEVVFNGLKEEKETEIEYGVAFYVPAHKEWMYLYHRTRIEAEDAVRSMVKKYPNMQCKVIKRTLSEWEDCQ